MTGLFHLPELRFSPFLIVATQPAHLEGIVSMGTVLGFYLIAIGCTFAILVFRQPNWSAEQTWRLPVAVAMLWFFALLPVMTGLSDLIPTGDDDDQFTSFYFILLLLPNLLIMPVFMVLAQWSWLANLFNSTASHLGWRWVFAGSLLLVWSLIGLAVGRTVDWWRARRSAREVEL